MNPIEDKTHVPNLKKVKKTKLEELGWIPLEDDPIEMELVLEKHKVIRKYHYILNSIILECVEKGYEKTLNRLLQEKPNPTCIEPCRKAAALGRTKMLQALIKAGYPTTPAKKGDLSALDAAARNDQTKAVKLLISLGSLPNKETFSDLVEATISKSHSCGIAILESLGLDIVEKILNKELSPLQIRHNKKNCQGPYITEEFGLTDKEIEKFDAELNKIAQKARELLLVVKMHKNQLKEEEIEI
jgi:hypothetical protein